MTYASTKAELFRFLVDSRGALRWWRREWAAPSAPAVKRRVLARHNIRGATWVETGTYRGDTTAFLSRLGAPVISLEPDALLFANAEKRFANSRGIRLVRGTSEELFDGIVGTLSGPVCFWLDGHFSGSGTYKSEADTPIVRELDVIGRHLSRLGPVAVLVDDFREFQARGRTGTSDYPSREFLVRWACANDLAWTVEHDIFIAETQAAGESTVPG